MLELMLCSMLTILPDFLYRRFVQGKRLGYEINFFSVWYELRWGVTTCLILTLSLITMIFYFHPSTKNAVSLFRTVPILAEGIGRVTEVKVNLGQEIKAAVLVLFCSILPALAYPLGFGLDHSRRSVIALSLSTRNIGAAIAPLFAVPGTDPRAITMCAMAVPVTVICSAAAARIFARLEPG